MPIPLLVWGAGALVAAGLGLAAKGALDNSEADNVNQSAQRISDDAAENLEKHREKTEQKLQDYGRQKLEAYEQKISRFISVYSELKNVELRESPELKKIQLGDSTHISIQDLQSSCSVAMSVLTGLGTGAATGALLAYGAYSGVGLFASTAGGAAISGLSGAAATNATLAWLGGGTLAAGGGGIAAGTMVLGGLVAGPAAIIFGSIFAANASKNLDDANTNKINAKEMEAKVNATCQKLDMICEVVDLASSTLSSLNGKLRRSCSRLETIIEENGVDYSSFSDVEKNAVFMGVKYAQLVKAVIDSPILRENGELEEDTKMNFLQVQKQLKAISA